MSNLYTEAELQELLKDKARLDWLEDVNSITDNMVSLRDAIDKAMLIESTWLQNVNEHNENV